jgi:gliding motility-associated-like protein
LPLAVIVNPIPVASILNTSTEVCAGQSLTLNAPVGFDDYTWSLNNATQSSTANCNVITALADAFTYELIVEENGCTSTPIEIDVVVNAFPLAIISPSGPINLCPGDDIDLSSFDTQSNYQYAWFENGSSIVSAASTTFNVSYQQATTIELEVTSNGCTSISAPFSIISNDVANTATWAAPPYAENNILATCLSDHPILGITDGAIIQWFHDGIPLAGETGLIVNAVDDGEYYFTSSLTGVCPIYSDTITVDLNVSMQIETTVSKDTACAGEVVQIVPNGNFASYSWPGGITADTLNVINTGRYVVTGHLVSCDTTDTADVFISRYPVVRAGDDFYSDCEDLTYLYGRSDGDETYWEMDGEVIGFGDSIIIASPQRTKTLVMISSLNGCERRDSVTIQVDCIYIYAPTAITPDGDGVNDVFRVYANGLTSYVLRIFNRYGQLVWESKDPDDVWTGGISQEYYVPNGVYTWQIDAIDINQQAALDRSLSKGTILVIR